ncbi:hypothetical protein EW145_g6424 [Phellinidium pouzarii]|uniref:DNA-directed RNA polymerase III subunit Rpc5 n=1 Tax=Phellinidium pouzarii TaxID=167371 RepID=A0A4S4KWP8_9AGAM|nr:hypothetical protein EW145_g6424 [Phellinidium pouzarii]
MACTHKALLSAYQDCISTKRMSATEDDPVVSVLPIHLSTALFPNIHLHQFPLLTRPLQVPPSAAQSGKKVRARLKHKAARLEVHVPVDTRPEVWNKERGQELGQARTTDDSEKDMDSKKEKAPVADQHLSEVRLRSEQIPNKGAYMLGIVRDGHIHLHPISQTHQLRPTLTYMDVHLRKSRRSRVGVDDDSDSDDGPPPDPDDPNPPAPVKKRTKSSDGRGERSGLTVARREMLHAMREEEEEPWQDFEYHDGETEEAAEAFNAIFSKSDDKLACTSDLASFFKNISGL